MPSLSKDKQVNVDSVVLPNDDYIVIRLDDVQKADASRATSAQSDELIKKMDEFLGKMSYVYYVKSATDAAKVTINQDALAAMSL